MKIVVLGLGVSGRDAALLAYKNQNYVTALDEKDSPALRDEAAKLIAQGIEVILGFKDAGAFPKAELVVTSPGIPDSSPMMQGAIKSGAEIISELEYGFCFCKTPIIAITGTNGKTTTTELTTHILKGLGYKAEYAGNIGVPLCHIVSNDTKLDYIVTEISSFQLEKSFKFAPVSATILNITSDHINRYKDFKDYASVKFKLFQAMKPGTAKILNSNLKEMAEEFTPETKYSFFSSINENADFTFKNDLIYFKSRQILSLSQTQLRGAHNAENLMAALALIHGVLGDALFDRKELIDVISSFKTDVHRIELFLEQNGVKYVNDSKATNPDAVLVALRTFGKNQNVVLLLGGLDKDMDFSLIKQEADKVKCAFIIGECKQKIYDTLKDSFPCTVLTHFDEAVKACCESGKSGDVVMLSPGCASMDMFKNYKERGDRFKGEVGKLLSGDTAK